MASVIVYATRSRGSVARSLLAAASQATGVPVSLEVQGTGGLFRRLREEAPQPQADLVLALGPYLAQSAVANSLLASYQPRAWGSGPQLPANLPLHHQDWRWVATDLTAFVAYGASATSSFAAILGSTEKIALPDPLRSEIGLFLGLATLDQDRRARGDPSPAWDGWQRIVPRLTLTDDVPNALAALGSGQAGTAIGLGETGSTQPGTALTDLPLIPNTASLVAGAPHAVQAIQLLDWLSSPDARAAGEAGGGLSPWAASANGLDALAASGGALDVEWTLAQYGATRRQWESRGFSPPVPLAA